MVGRGSASICCGVVMWKRRRWYGAFGLNVGFTLPFLFFFLPISWHRVIHDASVGRNGFMDGKTWNAISAKRQTLRKTRPAMRDGTGTTGQRDGMGGWVECVERVAHPPFILPSKRTSRALLRCGCRMGGWVQWGNTHRCGGAWHVVCASQQATTKQGGRADFQMMGPRCVATKEKHLHRTVLSDRRFLTCRRKAQRTDQTKTPPGAVDNRTGRWTSGQEGGEVDSKLATFKVAAATNQGVPLHQQRQASARLDLTTCHAMPCHSLADTDEESFLSTFEVAG
ncbi:hypothetical protein IWX50DRAFT_621016 [Phyllosticta citricarpa]|uniref:Uncharacterized protein n=1 Tax=Phyllosticta citricarpa TaxID=55181 RepID=A0ABR1MRL4_9PEZI